MGPRVAIAPCWDVRGRIRAGRRYHYVDAAYARAVVEAGGLPGYLAPPGDPAALLAQADGLLLPGGDDFLPERPDPEPVAYDPADPEQIAFDDALLAVALGRGLPVLGICYGMQLLARSRGGRLLYHLPRDGPGDLSHRLAEPDGRHPLAITPGSTLAGALGPDPGPVNSLHHQGVATPGTGLRVSARSPDGLVEAIEDDAGRFVLGVQWHPEKMEGAHRTRLFAAFVAACRSGAAGAGARG